MHQTVLMHADVDERAEVRHVGHDAFEQHAGFQVLDLFDPFAEGGGPEFRARIAAGLFQFAQDVAHGRQAEALVGVSVGRQLLDRCPIADHVARLLLQIGEDALDHRVRLRVHGRRVERVVAVHHAQEAGTLLEGLVAEARHPEQ